MLTFVSSDLLSAFTVFLNLDGRLANEALPPYFIRREPVPCIAHWWNSRQAE